MIDVTRLFFPLLLSILPTLFIFLIFNCAKKTDKKYSKMNPSNPSKEDANSAQKGLKTTESVNKTKPEGMDWNTVNIKEDEEQKTDLDLVQEEDDVWKNKTVRPVGANKPSEKEDKNNKNKENTKNKKEKKYKSNRKVASARPAGSVYTLECNTPAMLEAKRVNKEKNAQKTAETLATVSAYQDERAKSVHSAEPQQKNKGVNAASAKEKAIPLEKSKKVKKENKSAEKIKTQVQTDNTKTRSTWDNVQKTSATREGETDNSVEPDGNDEPEKKSAKKGNKKADFNASLYLS